MRRRGGAVVSFFDQFKARPEAAALAPLSVLPASLLEAEPPPEAVRGGDSRPVDGEMTFTAPDGFSTRLRTREGYAASSGGARVVRMIAEADPEIVRLLDIVPTLHDWIASVPASADAPAARNGAMTTCRPSTRCRSP